MSKRKLTAKQERFINALITGKKSQREAYKEAYNTENMKDDTIDNCAYRLLNRPEVKERYEELLEEHKQKALYTREEAVLDLIYIKEKAKEEIEKKGVRQATMSAFLGAVKELCTIEDLYPDKRDKEDSKTEREIAKVLKEAMKDI
jgi:hypothetical protein